MPYRTRAPRQFDRLVGTWSRPLAAVRTAARRSIGCRGTITRVSVTGHSPLSGERERSTRSPFVTTFVAACGHPIGLARGPERSSRDGSSMGGPARARSLVRRRPRGGDAGKRGVAARRRIAAYPRRQPAAEEGRGQRTWARGPRRLPRYARPARARSGTSPR